MRKLIYCILFIPTVCLGQRVVEVNFPSKTLHETRKLWIGLPAHYELRKDNYHLIVLLDGDNQSLFNYTVAAKRFLEDNSVDLSDYNAPESIIVGIEQKDRAQDFKKNAPQFLAFLSGEVLPYLAAHYRTANYRILIGHSLAGRFALYTLTEQPSLFNAVIAASPAYSAKDVLSVTVKIDSVLHAGLKRDLAVYISTTDRKNDQTEAQFRPFAESLAAHYDTSKIAGFRFRFHSSATLGHGKSPYFAIPEGLHFIYDPGLWQLNADSLADPYQDALKVYRHYEDMIRRRFGVAQPMGNYTGFIAAQLQQAGRTAEAIRLMETQLMQNPTDLDLFAQLLGLLKKQSASKYRIYKTRFVFIMAQLKISAEDQKAYLHQIESSE